jgi:GTP-binding protein
VDTNIPPQANDTQLITYLKQSQKPYLVVGTKADRMSGNVLAKSIAALKRAHEVEEILPISAKTDAGIKTLWARLLTVAEQE